MTETQQKPKLKSRTIQYNSLWMLIATTMLIAFSDNQELIQEYVPPWAYLIIIMINSGVGVYLRTITFEAVKPFKGNFIKGNFVKDNLKGNFVKDNLKGDL